MENKIKNKHGKVILMAVFALAMMVGLGLEKNVKAQTWADTVPASNQAPTSWTDTPTDQNNNPIQSNTSIDSMTNPTDSNGNPVQSNTSIDSMLNPTDANGNPIQSNTSIDSMLHPTDAQGKEIKDTSNGGMRGDAGVSKDDKDVCGFLDYLPGINLMKCILLLILRFVSSLLSLAATIFAWMVKPDTMLKIMGDPIIYQMWALVRDVLNIAFILVLLFSAFCTVFQIASYNYKKILLNLVIMALLVNFSFPIARVIIDFANVIMYFFLNNLPFGSGATGGNLFATIANNGQLGEIIKLGTGSSTWLIISAIVFTFILAITLLAIAVLLVIRTVALTVLIIFSSVAFVGSVVPGLSSEAKKWWTNLFKYAFFGPTIVFMIYIATNMIGKIGTQQSDVLSIANGITADSNFIAAVSFFCVPIVILWMGIAFAQSSSVIGAKAVMGRATKTIGWAGRTLSGYRTAAWAGRGIKKGVSYGAKAGIRKFERDVLAQRGLSPRAFLEAWKKNFEATEEQKLKPAMGAWRDRMNSWKIFGGKKTNFEQLERDRLMANKLKEYKEQSDDNKFVNDQIGGLVGRKTNDARARLKALITMHWSNNDQDELVDYVAQNLEKPILPGGKTFKDVLGIEDNDIVYKKDDKGNILRDKDGFAVVDRSKTRGMGVSAENATEIVEKIMASTYQDPESAIKGEGEERNEINRLLLNLDSISAAKGGVGYGSVKYDSAKKMFVRTDSAHGEQAALNAAKILTTGEAQNIPKTMHRNHFTDQHGNLNNTGKELLFRYAGPTAMKHIERHKTDFYKRVGADSNVTKQMYDFAKDLREGKASVWDFDNNEQITDKKDANQAKQAAAWTAALQSKSGVSLGDIQKAVTKAGFDWAEIKDIAKSAGAEIKAPGKEETQEGQP